MSHHFRVKPRRAGNPLPKRNRKENVIRRIAAAIPNQHTLNTILSLQPGSLRVGYYEALRPHLRFEACNPYENKAE